MKAKLAISMASIAGIAGLALFLTVYGKDQEVANANQYFLEPGTPYTFNATKTTDPNVILDSKDIVVRDKFWEKAPNTSDTFGKNINEIGPREFLNHSQKILQKALKNETDVQQMSKLFQTHENFRVILDHYTHLPDQFYFVEEASRIKMLNFLTSSLELSGEWQGHAIIVMQQIANTNVRLIKDQGLAQSVAGDVIRILAAISKYNKAAYEQLTQDLKNRNINSKVIAYFEQQKSGSTFP